MSIRKLLLAGGLTFAGGFAAAWLVLSRPPAPAVAPSLDSPVPADPASGKWRRRGLNRDADSRTAEPQAETLLPELSALPYLAGYRPAGSDAGVTRYDPKLAVDGVNLAISGHAAEAVLFAMDGRELHRWRLPLRRAFPGLPRDETTAALDYWRRVHLLSDGSLLAIYDGLGMVRVDRGSRRVWAHRGGIHHDLCVLDDGSIIALDRIGKLVPRIHPTEGVLEDLVTTFDSDGTVREQVSVLTALESSDYRSLLFRRKPQGDILHTNTIECLDGRGSDRLPALAAGNLLLSILELDAVVVLDPRQGKIVWALAGMTRKQHQPTLLPGPSLLIFDNLAGPESSRVLEINPLTQQVSWQYGGKPDQPLWSKTLGSVARLARGNTLITESEAGRALEVTRDGEIVWEYWNPHRVRLSADATTGKQDELVASLFEVVRFDRASVERWLDLPAVGGVGRNAPAVN